MLHLFGRLRRLCSHHFNVPHIALLLLNYALSFVRVVDAAEAKRDTRRLNDCFVAQEALWVCLPWAYHALLKRRSIHLIEELAHGDRAVTIFTMNDALDPLVAITVGTLWRDHGFAVVKLHTVKLRVTVNNAKPTINTNHRHNAVLAIWKRVNLAGKWIQLVLVCHHRKRHHLLRAWRLSVALLKRGGG